MQLAEKSHHMELKHHEDSLNPLHSLKMKSHVQSSQKNNICRWLQQAENVLHKYKCVHNLPFSLPSSLEVWREEDVEMLIVFYFEYLISNRSESRTIRHPDVTFWPMRKANIMSSDSWQPITGRTLVNEVLQVLIAIRQAERWCMNYLVNFFISLKHSTCILLTTHHSINKNCPNYNHSPMKAMTSSEPSPSFDLPLSLVLSNPYLTMIRRFWTSPTCH